MVVREKGSTARKVVEAPLSKAGVWPIVVMEPGSREAIREAVAKGIGVGTVPEAAYTPEPRLRRVRFSNADAHTETHVFCLRVRQSARVVRALLDVAEEMPRANCRGRGRDPRGRHARRDVRELCAGPHGRMPVRIVTPSLANASLAVALAGPATSRTRRFPLNSRRCANSAVFLSQYT